MITPTVGDGADLAAVSVAFADSFVFLTDLLRGTTASTDGSNITVIAVDANEITGQAIGFDILNNNISWTTIVRAITT